SLPSFEMVVLAGGGCFCLMGTDNANRLEHAKSVPIDVVFGPLTVFVEAADYDAAVGSEFAGRRKTHKWSQVCACYCVPPDDFIAFGYHVFDGEVNVGKAGAEGCNEALERLCAAWKAGGAGIVDHVIGGIHLVDQVEIAFVPAAFDPAGN